jgi:hypothetical protein
VVAVVVALAALAAGLRGVRLGAVDLAGFEAARLRLHIELVADAVRYARHPSRRARHGRALLCVDSLKTENLMKEERRKILSMLSEGKISTHEADALLDALAASASAAGELPRLPVSPNTAASARAPKYLRVLVEGSLDGKENKVNVRVPLDLIRAGMRLAALLPAVAYEPVNRALKQNGVDLDVSKIKPENLEDLVAHLQELSVDVDSDGEKVRVFCE